MERTPDNTEEVNRKMALLGVRCLELVAEHVRANSAEELWENEVALLCCEWRFLLNVKKMLLTASEDPARPTGPMG